VTWRELQALSQIRLREARALARLGMHDGAYYLAGYCIECALKACIAKATQRRDFPDKRKAEASFTHSFKELLKVAGLVRAQTEEGQSRAATAQPTWRRLEGSLKLWEIAIKEYSDG
jgi:HEPN domain-containing protein